MVVDRAKLERPSDWTLGEHPRRVPWNYSAYGHFREPPSSVKERAEYEDWIQDYDFDIALWEDTRVSSLRDYVRWCLKAEWSIFQATALSFGVDPELILDEMHNAHLFGRFFYDRKTFITHAQMNRELPDPLTPHQFVAWASGTLSYPDQLDEALDAITKGRSPEDAELSVVNRRAAYLLILAMAEDTHEYKSSVKKQKENVPKLISDEAKELGMEVSDETVRKRLRDAEEESPESHSEQPIAGISESAEGRSLDDVELSPAMRETAYRLILTLAIRGYGYTVRKADKKRLEEMSKAANARGANVDAETVGLWLLDAAKENPQVLKSRELPGNQ